MKELQLFNTEIEQVYSLVFKPCKFELTNVERDAEGQDYAAHNLVLNGMNIKFRKAKITPTKVGQFVAIWKRNNDGITAPFDMADNIDFIFIVVRRPANYGVFIFPKRVLHKYKIVSDGNSDGKRGIRVYPPWDVAASKQAENTQKWQMQYFLNILPQMDFDLSRAKQLLADIV